MTFVRKEEEKKRKKEKKKKKKKKKQKKKKKKKSKLWYEPVAHGTVFEDLHKRYTVPTSAKKT